jgi:hypothetical protein
VTPTAHVDTAPSPAPRGATRPPVHVRGADEHCGDTQMSYGADLAAGAVVAFAGPAGRRPARRRPS